MYDGQDTTNQNGGKQPEISADPKAEILPPALAFVSDEPHVYDAPMIEGFMNGVFHIDKGERAMFATKTRGVGYPKDISNVLKSGKAQKLYFCTASLKRDESGYLRHRSSSFAALHVVVLDDIGTKIPVSSIPEKLQTPSYIIESSEGNFQYGYILDTPITDYGHAEQLLKAVKRAGITDEGGVLVCKAVRLPDGINGKPGDKGKFHVKLVDDTGPLFTPEFILTQAKADVTWAQVLSGDVPEPLRAPVKLLTATGHAPATETVDEVSEWLYQHKKVYHDDGEWLTVQCPWAHEHSTGDDSAGYSPVGRGGDDYMQSRGFNCFHDHCKDKKGDAFVQWVLLNSDFDQLAVHIPLSAQFPNAKYVFDAQKGRVFDLLPRPLIREYAAFKRTKSAELYVYRAFADKPKPMHCLDYWAASPYTTKADGETYRAGEPVLYDDNGRTLVNSYMPPPWTDGPFDMAAPTRFVEYLEYLVPDGGERAYFLDWLTAKVQDVRFRGTAILMVTDGVQGVGRSTLGKIVTDLLGSQNASSIQFDNMIDRDSFNEWLRSLVVVVDEVRSSDMNRFQQNEKLKTYIDTSPTKAELNIKHGFKGQVETCASFLMFSNHLDAVALNDDDRRMTVLRNTDVKNDVLTADVNQWRLNVPSYAQDIYRWLRQRPVDTARLYHPYASAAKAQMIADNKSPMTRIVEAIKFAMEQKGYVAIEPKVLKDISEQLAGALDVDNWSKAYRRASGESFTPTLRKFTIKKAGAVHKIRLLKGFRPGVVERKAADFEQADETQIRDDIENIDVTEITSIARDALSD